MTAMVPQNHPCRHSFRLKPSIKPSTTIVFMIGNTRSSFPKLSKSQAHRKEPIIKLSTAHPGMRSFLAVFISLLTSLVSDIADQLPDFVRAHQLSCRGDRSNPKIATVAPVSKSALQPDVSPSPKAPLDGSNCVRFPFVTNHIYHWPHRRSAPCRSCTRPH